MPALSHDSSAPASTLVALARAAAERDPGATAIVAPGRSALTYEGLARLVERTSRTLREAGFEPGARIALSLPNGPEAATAFPSIASAATVAPPRRRSRMSEPTKPISGERAPCRHCGKPFRTTLAVCPFCRKAQTEDGVPLAKRPAPSALLAAVLGIVGFKPFVPQFVASPLSIALIRASLRVEPAVVMAAMSAVCGVLALVLAARGARALRADARLFGPKLVNMGYALGALDLLSITF